MIRIESKVLDNLFLIFFEMGKTQKKQMMVILAHLVMSYNMLEVLVDFEHMKRKCHHACSENVNLPNSNSNSAANLANLEILCFGVVKIRSQILADSLTHKLVKNLPSRCLTIKMFFKNSLQT